MKKSSRNRIYSRADASTPAGLVIILSLFALLTATACKNPLVGLGARVDLTPPEGTVTGISNGDYVSGDITLTGTI